MLFWGTCPTSIQRSRAEVKRFSAAIGAGLGVIDSFLDRWVLAVFGGRGTDGQGVAGSSCAGSANRVGRSGE